MYIAATTVKLKFFVNLKGKSKIKDPSKVEVDDTAFSE